MVTFVVLFRRSAADFLNSLPDKSQRIIKEKLALLKTDPYPGKTGGKKRLNTDETDVYRLHIGRSFTVLYLIHTDAEEPFVEVTHLMTIEQAHKRYGRL